MSDKTYRNIQEQVLKNAQDIARLKELPEDQIGLQGEQGIQGIQGPIGPQGQRGNKWTVSSAAPADAINGDCWLDYSGLVKVYINGVWNPTYSLQGPQGIQGNTGPQGEQGIQGPIGPQGPQGVQGEQFVISGPVATVDNLPEPDTVASNSAYLVGVSAPYAFYVVSDGNTWVNVGTFATLDNIQKVIIDAPEGAISGTLTQEQLNLLINNDVVLQLGYDIYHKTEDQEDDGYWVYTSFNNVYISVITVMTAGSWTKTTYSNTMVADDSLSSTSTNPVQNKVIFETITPLMPMTEQPFQKTLNLSDFKITKVYTEGGTNNGYYNLDCTISDTTYGVHTDLVNISLVDKIKWKSNLNNSGCGLVFFDIDKQPIIALKVIGGSANSELEEYDLTTAKAGGAVYASVSGFSRNAEIVLCAKAVVSKNALAEDLADQIDGYEATIEKTKAFYEHNLCLGSFYVEKIWASGAATNNGFVYKSDGHIDSISEGVNTGYIDISLCDCIEVESQISGDGKAIAFYDENKNYLSSLGEDQSTRTNTNPTYFYDLATAKANGAVYVIISSYHERVSIRLLAKQRIDLDAVKNTTRDQIMNVPSPIEKKIPLSVEGKFIKVSDGKYEVGYYNGGTSDFIAVAGVYAVNAKGTGNDTVASVAFYDEKYQYLSNYTINSGPNGLDKNGYTWVFIQEVKPENACYFRISSYDSSEKTDKNGGRYFIAKGQSPLNGKNILVFGDSISDSTSINIDTATKTCTTYSLPMSSNFWTRIMYDKVAPKELRCYAQSQAKYPFDDNLFLQGERKCATYQVEMALADASNPNNVFPQNDFVPDVIIFALGTNGDLNDTYESALAKTVYQTEDNRLVDVDATIANLDIYNYMEAMRWCYMKVKKQWSKAQLFQIIPPQRGYADDFTGSQNTKYMEQVKMAQYYGATIIDLRGESGICRDFQADTLGDTLHPNKVGNDLYARNVIKRVEASYMDVEDMNLNE